MANEQDRPDVLRKRWDWFDSQPDLAPRRLVFVEETWAKTNMARTHGRCRRGERLRMGMPHGHWKTTTFVAGLTTRGMVAPFVLSGPINRAAFEAYVERVLVPERRPGDIVRAGPRTGGGLRPSPRTPCRATRARERRR